jgi:AhpD family alkylhydroperoxidase
MNTRLDWWKTVPAVGQALLALQKVVNDSGLERPLMELVKLRASQINGCAFCIDMHTQDARAAGETEQRLYLLDAWHEAREFYSERERAALAWTEAVTVLGADRVADESYEQARARFSEAELVKLTLAVAAINAWNRLNIAFRAPPGNYRPGMIGKLAHA